MDATRDASAAGLLRLAHAGRRVVSGSAASERHAVIGHGMQLLKIVQRTAVSTHFRSTACWLQHLNSALPELILQTQQSLEQQPSSHLHTSSRCQVAALGSKPTGKSSYVDRLRVEVRAGSGGSGCVAFWKSAAKGQHNSRMVLILACIVLPGTAQIWCL